MRSKAAQFGGFSLIELMVVMAIIAILAAIAYPSYQRHLVKGSRAEAQSYLMDAAQRQQQFLMDSRAYADDAAALNDAPNERVRQYYTVSFATDANGGGCAPAPCFVLTATPIPGTRQATDPVLTLDNTGRKTPSTVWQ